MEISFSDLRNKEVINVLSGRLLGNINDVIIDLNRNCIIGFVVPGCKSIFNVFKQGTEIFIPFNNICKIGEDVVLVEVIESPSKKNKQCKNKSQIRVFDAGETETNTAEYKRDNK